MEKTVNSADPCLKFRQINQFYKNKKTSNSQNQMNIPACERSRSALIDVIILIAVIGACGVLFYPSVSLLVRKTVELGEEVVDVVREEIVDSPIVFGCLGLSILFAAITLVTIAVCIDRRCGKRGCKGLRKAAEFDLQLETEEGVKKSNYVATNGLKKGLFELPRDHHRELEAELKKMAPPKGRAVLVFRARCGCSVGRMEVPGPKKSRKVKK
ncbi:Ribosomal protein L34e superfamily protein [Abeliophyllum distichum]|uniref:Ribosomal protein L34e superfamily protein n=1 Tax=Abeliophyllum distichum TaxID=126358 RepID=A0ABD1V4I4_9LAMI